MADRRRNLEQDARPCQPLELTHREARMLLIAAGGRLERLTRARAQGNITGAELDERIEVWRRLIGKISEIAGE